MRKAKIIFAGFMVVGLYAATAYAQSNEFSIPKQTELNIPVSPAYQMLDAGSALVNSPAAIRDFRVDWSFRTYRLSPNLAIEAQPVWAIFYNRPTVEKYQNAGKFMQTLSTLSLSAGTLDASDTSRLLAWAGKMTVYRQYDPLTDKGWFKEINDDYEQQRITIEDRISNHRSDLRKTEDRFAKDSIDQLIVQARMELEALRNTQKGRIKERQEALKARYWNSAAVDVAYGRSYSFNQSISERIDSIQTKELGNSVWVNGAFGIGRHALVTGQVRHENLKLVIADSGKTTVTVAEIEPISGDTIFTEVDSLFVNFNTVTENILSLGLNIRFGSPRFNFFTEIFYTKTKIPTFQDTEWETWSDYGNGGLKKTAEIKEQTMIAFGGEWRVSGSVLLSYGIRTQVDEHLKFRNIIPLASISCLMR